MKKIIHVGVFNPEDGTLTYHDILDDLAEYYRLIPCQTIDITFLHGMEVVLDDEGLLKESSKPSYIDADHFFVGGLVFTGRANDQGELTSLTERDVSILEVMRSCIRRIIRGSKPSSTALVIDNLTDRQIRKMIRP